MTDREMLDAYVSGRDDQAFEALVHRHGPMVLRICRNILDDSHAADDAFQQTFLVLANLPAAIRKRDSLGSWLHGVATRVSTRVRSRSRRRHIVERSGVEVAFMPERNVERSSEQREIRPILDEEIERLPSKLRAAIVICYFEGVTCEAAAERLHVPLGTLKGRLSRGRELLRSRLARRGVTASVLMLLLLLTEEAPAVEADLVEATVSSARRLVDGRRLSIALRLPLTARGGLLLILGVVLAVGVSLPNLTTLSASHRAATVPTTIPDPQPLEVPTNGSCH